MKEVPLYQVLSYKLHLLIAKNLKGNQLVKY